MNPIRWALPLSAALVLATGCSKAPESSAAPTVMAEARAVSVTQVVLRPMAGTLTASGLLVPREEAAVGSELSGFRVAQVLVEEGASVEQGQTLAKLDPGLLQARIAQAVAALAQSRAQAKQAQGEAARVAGLDGTGILSDEQIHSRRAQAQGANAAVQVAEAQLNDLRAQERRLLIRAPVAGTVLERMVRPGDVALPSQPMFRIARDGLIELDAEVPEAALAKIAVGQRAQVELASGAKFDGTARLLSPRVDAQTKLGRVRVRLPLDPALRAGGYASVVFSREASPVPAVPEKAIQFEASGPLVIVIDEQRRAQRMPVQTAGRADGFVAIEQGPPVGTSVALGGGAFLLDGDLVDPVEARPTASHAQARN
ncbi:efflux RND transporter periplasmic adaptor subunit [Pseudomonas benzenivorans]|uniref:Efflux RND transporter periplasmic adaptor subunit n=1 Tax=Pseudomonas benzenivorans TaxID=556533 RepID=A0ABY5HAQ8_9PSED|nr:efflux RND transporter periplasmic adaptor subunit [Pseudomonas benzenivorans]UTW08464.1 efflux RND transporter periplasmic adaptor subunit [Pseudomonas benzenivorans]